MDRFTFPKDSSHISRPRLLISLENIATSSTLEHISRVFQAPNILPNWHSSQQKLMQIFITFFFFEKFTFLLKLRLKFERNLTGFSKSQQKE